MTVMLDLNPEQEKLLHGAAEARGVDADALANEILRRALAYYAETLNVTKERVLGLIAGNFWIADDFDAPLPDSYWLGEE
ncbi:MAG: hypothetical protein ACLQVD_20910 [Capsulimonadaceae bacterium]